MHIDDFCQKCYTYVIRVGDKMVNIAIVEDDAHQAIQLETALKRYSEEFRTPLKTSVFYNAMSFLGKYTAEYDIIFMDILMPMMNGMDAARILREKDEKVMVIFVTNMQQYAIQGYEVGAFDFILKPVSYPEFKLKFTRALSKLMPQKKAASVLIKSESGMVRLTPAQIIYVEVQQHHCIYHTIQGDYKQYQTMKSVESQLADFGFARCNNYLLINLAYVSKIEGMNVHVNGTVLPVSYPRKKPFSDKFSEFMGADR